MTPELNSLGQPLGPLVPDWSPPPLPEHAPLTGRWCRLEPLNAARHAAGLHEANSLDTEGSNWTYLPAGPHETLDAYSAWVASVEKSGDPLFFAIIDTRTSLAVGVCAWLRLQPSDGSLEIGHLNFSPLLQRTPAATEALFLMIEHGFSLGYRRCEWKCDSLNAPSRTAALRIGYSYEGTFRQATVRRGRNRDSAWYAIIDAEWPALRSAIAGWLKPENFDESGRQRTRLSELTRPLLHAVG